MRPGVCVAVKDCPKQGARHREAPGSPQRAIRFDRHGDLDLNILIRTLTLSGTQASLRAGAGIVVDSVAALELEETRAKARGLLRALGVPG